MAAVADVKEKVQRIISSKFGSVRLDEDGRIVFPYESAMLFVSIKSFGKDGVRVTFVVPMVKNLRISNELCRWVAIEGQKTLFGSCRLDDSNGENDGWVFFEHSILGDDLDESELLNALVLVAAGANDLDNQIYDRFGGELFGEDDN
jgi:hypothetical protein